jgi:hypothetical protein
VLGVDAAHVLRSWGKPRPIAGTAAEIANALPPIDWKRLPVVAGTNGPRRHDWICFEWICFELADLGAEESNNEHHGLWTRGLPIRRNLADGTLPISPLGVRRGHRSRRWSTSRAIAGRSRTASRPPGTSSVSTPTKPDPGMAGIVTSRWPCSPLPCRLPSGIRPTSRHPKKRNRRNQEADPPIRCSIQGIRRIAQRLARKCTPLAYVIAWSLWRRAHQAAAQNAQRRQQSQL